MPAKTVPLRGPINIGQHRSIQVGWRCIIERHPTYISENTGVLLHGGKVFRVNVDKLKKITHISLNLSSTYVIIF